MSKRTSWQRRVPEENSMSTMSASVKRRLSSEHLQSQNCRGMTTTCCPGSNRSFWWGFAPVITDWTVICTVNWSWHPRQLSPVVEKSRPRSMFYKDAPFTKPQEKTCGLSALPWRPNSTAASRSWRRRRHSSPERPWSCRLRTPRRRRRWDVFVRPVGRSAGCPSCVTKKLKHWLLHANCSTIFSYLPISFKLGMMVETTEFNILIWVWMPLAFIQCPSCITNQKLTCPYSRKFKN